MKNKAHDKYLKNIALLKNCSVHNFDLKTDFERVKAIKKLQEEKYGVVIGNPSVSIYPTYCRCKNCGGKMPFVYAVAYMDAINAIERQKRKEKGCNE